MAFYDFYQNVKKSIEILKNYEIASEKLYFVRVLVFLFFHFDIRQLSNI